MRLAGPILSALTIIAVACGLVSAAGHTAAGTQAGPMLDVCGLLAKAEVEAAVGTPVLAPRAQNVGQDFDCMYGHPAVPGLNIVSLKVLIGINTEQARLIFNTTKAANAQDVTGLGDAAYWTPASSDLAVIRGKFDVIVKVPALQGKDVKSIAHALALKVIARLP